MECKLKEVGALEPSFSVAGEKKKLGRYVGGSLPVEGYGIYKWGIAANIITPNPPKTYLSDKMTEEDVVNLCLSHLNYKKKWARKLQYGKLECRYFIFQEDSISVSLISDDRNNKNFWGRGQVNKIGKRKYNKKKR